MAISRPLLFALVGVLVVFAGVTAMRAFGGATQPSAPPKQSAAAPQPSPTTANPSGAKSSGKAPGEAKGKPADSPPKDDGVPARVARALDQHKVVVLFFGARGHDDRATARAVRELRSSDAVVFIDSGTRIDRYARVVGALPVTELPSTIVVDRERTAQVVDGYADLGTLRQLVADAR